MEREGGGEKGDNRMEREGGRRRERGQQRDRGKKGEKRCKQLNKYGDGTRAVEK